MRAIIEDTSPDGVFVKITSKFWFNDYFEIAEFLEKVDRFYNTSNQRVRDNVS